DPTNGPRRRRAFARLGSVEHEAHGVAPLIVDVGVLVDLAERRALDVAGDGAEDARAGRLARRPITDRGVDRLELVHEQALVPPREARPDGLLGPPLDAHEEELAVRPRMTHELEAVTRSQDRLVALAAMHGAPG